jgi:acyl-CoA thioesterase
MADPSAAPAGISPAQAAAHAQEPGAFERDTAVRRVPSGGEEDPAEAIFRAEVSPYWRAGRGPHGGYLAAMLTRALLEAVGDAERAPRSITIHYARAPAPGPVSIRVVHERAGRSLSTLSARMEQEGKLIALALAAFSVAWSAPELAEAPMPLLPGPDRAHETTPWLTERVLAGTAPQFLQQMVVQPRVGEPPFSGSQAPMLAGAWLGLRDPSRPVDAISLALFSDALYSPPFVRLSGPATSPTVDLTIHFRRSFASAETTGSPGLCFAQFRTRLAHEGFFEEDGIIWAADGTLLAQSRQLAILMPLEIG